MGLVRNRRYVTNTVNPQSFVVVTFIRPTKSDTQGDTQNDTQNGTLDRWIENQIRKNPRITTDELAKLSKKGIATIKRHIAKMPRIHYVGSGYSDHWKIDAP